jgi:hypothetical protein
MMWKSKGDDQLGEVGHGASDVLPAEVPRRPVLKLTVAVRRQTSDEERRFKAALDAFLAALVRLELGRRENANGTER